APAAFPPLPTRRSSDLGVAFARELGNLPPNVCNPAYLAEQAQAFAARFDKASCTVLDEGQMQDLEMGALLSVARGSANRPRLIRSEEHTSELQSRENIV